MQYLILFGMALATLTACVYGQESSDAADPTTPGPEHKNLMAFVGTWELTVDGVPQKGSAEIKSILGGRFITEDVKIPFGDFDMDWHGVIGFDRVQKQYTGVWFDNMNNTTRSTTGQAEENGRVISFRGEHAGQAKFQWRISNDGDKLMTIEMFQVAEDGKETQVMKVLGAKQR